MKQKRLLLSILLIIAFSLLFKIQLVDAKEKTVYSFEELKTIMESVERSKPDFIKLGADITLSTDINWHTYEDVLDLNGFKMDLGSNFINIIIHDSAGPHVVFTDSSINTTGMFLADTDGYSFKVKFSDDANEYTGGYVTFSNSTYKNLQNKGCLIYVEKNSYSNYYAGVKFENATVYNWENLYDSDNVEQQGVSFIELKRKNTIGGSINIANSEIQIKDLINAYDHEDEKNIQKYNLNYFTFNGNSYDKIISNGNEQIKDVKIYKGYDATFTSNPDTIFIRRFYPNGGSYVGNEICKRQGYGSDNCKYGYSEPTKEGYKFDGWYIDKKLQQKYDFKYETDLENDNDFNLYAKWVGAYNINRATIEGVKDKTYNGNIQTQNIKVIYKGKELANNFDYKISYKDNKNAGKAKIIITGIGKYCGTLEQQFNINPINFESKKVIVSGIKDKKYNKKKQVQKIKVRYNNEILKVTKISYKNNKNIGTATMKITIGGNYKGAITKTFKIIPSNVSIKKIIKKKKSIYLTNSTVQGKVKYQIAYMKKGSNKWKYINTSKKTVKIKKLKSKKKYIFKVRAYKKINNLKYYGMWSRAKTIKTK